MPGRRLAIARHGATFVRESLGHAAIALALLAPPASHAAWFKDAITEPFLVPAAFGDVDLSADGRTLASVATNAEGRSGVFLFDTTTGAVSIAVRPEVDWTDAKQHGFWRDARTVAWIGDDLLAVNFSDQRTMQVDLRGDRMISMGQRYLGLVRPDNDPDKAAVVLAGGDGDRIYFARARSSNIHPLRVNLPGKVSHWLTDADGILRVVQTIEQDAGANARSLLKTWYRTERGAPWQCMDQRSVNDDPFDPVGLRPDAGRILVRAYNGGDRLAIWNFDVARRQFMDAAAADPVADIVDADATADGKAFASVRTDGLKPRRIWFDDRMARLQLAVDKAVPDHVNELRPAVGSLLMVRSYSDVDPGRITMFDTGTDKVRPLVVARPGIEPARMQPMQALTYRSFDGLEIPAYLTLPGKPARPAPLVVLIHGGPQARDHWGWNQEVQLLAAHGYAVFQPQFRGSTGFGKRFEEAGYGQWGRAMQDDITAGVHWLIDSKIVDPARICIVGRSYGGYAALWGLEKTPELYKCGVSVAGVTDLERELTQESDISTSELASEVVQVRIGDPKRMAQDFDAISPLKHADRIQVPTLIVHGTRDKRVPISQGRAMFDALHALGKDAQWIEFEEEAHTLGRQEDQRKYYDALFALLARTIGRGTPPQP